jgi:RsiW-degrading membrane proteinase PrsW (M82 family)
MYFGPITLIVLSLAPVAFLLWYFDRLDKKQKESRRFLWSIFLWGLLVTFVAGAVEYFLENTFANLITDPLVYTTISAFIFIAVTEEGLKYWVVKKKAYDHPAFNEYYDGIIYAVVASLGFAALENIFYVLEGGVSVAIIRALLAVPAHALFGAIMGYNIGLARFEKDKRESGKLLRKGLFWAIFFHGLYDFLLLTSSGLALFVIPMLLGMYLYVKRKIRYLHFLDKVEGSYLPKKWTIWTYIKVGIGMLFFTLGLLTIFSISIYLTQDPLGQGLFTNIDFSIPSSSIFAGITWLIAFGLMREKNTSITKNV